MARRYAHPGLATELASWCRGSLHPSPRESDDSTPASLIWVPSPGRQRAAGVGDWIVEITAGHFRVVDPLEFAARFQPAG